MIERMEISSVHTEVDEDLHKYVTKKIGNLDRFVQRLARPSLHAEVKLKENQAKNKKQYTCEVILHLPREQIMVSDTTMNMYAAVDIVEAKLKNQLKKYKEKRLSPRSSRKNSSVRRFLGKIIPSRRPRG